MDTLPFAQLQVLLAVARAGNFSAAARDLAVSRSAVSQAIAKLEETLGVVLVRRTTRSVALTDAGRQLVDGIGPALNQTAAVLAEVSAQSGAASGSLRLTLPHLAVPIVAEPVLPTFRALHPRIDVDLILEDRMIDAVAGGYDAGIRFTSVVERDMVQRRISKPFRFVVVGSPHYFAHHPVPRHPDDLLDHECIGFRSPTTGQPYVWELEGEHGDHRVPVRGGVATNHGATCATLARLGLGLAYVAEPIVRADLASGALERVLEPYASTVPGFFIYYPSRAQRSTPLTLFVSLAREILLGAP